MRTPDRAHRIECVALGIFFLLPITAALPAVGETVEGSSPSPSPSPSPSSSSSSSSSLQAKLKADLANVEQALAQAAPAQDVSEDPSSPDSLRHVLSRFAVKGLPPEPIIDHKANMVMKLPHIRIDDLVAIASLHPLEIDARYSEPFTLRQALEYAAYNSLPIKISRHSYDFQRWQLLGAVLSALPIPNFSTGYSLTQSKTLPNTIERSEVFPVSVRYPVFQGGALVFAAMAQYYREQGWHQAYHASVNDALLDVYQSYHNLLLQHALLRIRVQAMAVSQAQLHLSNVQYRAGQGTALAIMQSRTQLAVDRQALVDQQVAVRQAALALAFSINLPMSINIVPTDLNLRQAGIVQMNQPLDTWLAMALRHRPELRQFELFKLAAARNVYATAASLYPSFSFTTAFTQSKTTISPAGGTVGGVAVATLTAAQNGLGTATANALGQTASFSPTGNTTANSGISNTVATQIVEASGGQPLNVIQSGSLVTSGAASPSFISSGGSGSGANINGSNAPGAGVFGGSVQNFQAAFGGSWSLSNLGLTVIANTYSNQILNRQALLQCNQELLLVGEQIRGDYCNLQAAQSRVDNAAVGVVSAAENLRLNNLRMTAGTGTNLEAIQAQRDYVNALVTQAQALITSNIAQAQMLHDTGAVSIDALTSDADTDTYRSSK
jgi:outer membrane protein TolC